LLWLVAEMKKAGELPAELVLKISVMMGPATSLPCAGWSNRSASTT
jgi:hypothetical protein